MARFSDYLYTADLVRRIQAGNETAFGELYLTTYQKIYHFCHQYVHDDVLSLKALELTYTKALKNIGQLKEPTLVITWLYQLAFQTCHSIVPRAEKINVDGQVYLIGNILNLPFTEAQVILMTYLLKMDLKSVSQQLEMQKPIVRKYLTYGKRHLKQLH